jgi:hypothetical protein
MTDRQNTWSEADHTILRELWTKGLSGRNIAPHLTGNLSAAAIYKRARKLGLPLREGIRTGRPQKARPRPVVAFVEPLGVVLWERTGCAWPVNDGNPYRFCDHQRQSRSSYCQHHAERMIKS